MVGKLGKYMNYIYKRKQELEHVDRWKLINDLIIKELENQELEIQLNEHGRI
jgi:hypothetical protein